MNKTLDVAMLKTLGISETLYPHIRKVFDTYQINTPLREIHFLAQVLHESGNLKVFQENLNYSADALTRVFGKYFSPAAADTYARKPNLIANVVYANRMGNGDVKSGEGWKYRGRGAIQITGKANYSVLSKRTGIDFVSNPDLLIQPEYALLSAGDFWDRFKLNINADHDDVSAITKIINGGYNGLDDRKAKLSKLRALYG